MCLSANAHRVFNVFPGQMQQEATKLCFVSSSYWGFYVYLGCGGFDL